MSQENVDVVVKQYDDTNARNFAAVMDAYAEDVELVMHGDKAGMLGRTVSGKTAVGEWFGDWFRQFDRDYRFDVEESRGVGDRVLLVATHHGQGRDSGVPVRERWAYVYTVREGKVSRVEVWGDRDAREAALQALGPSEYVERVLRGYAALNRGDVDGAVAGLSPDCQLELPPILPEAGTYHGRDGLKQMWEAWRETFEEFRMEVEETIDAGNKVVVMAAICGTGKDSGAEVRTPTFPFTWTFRDDQVVRMEAHPTRAEALKAVGLDSEA